MAVASPDMQKTSSYELFIAAISVFSIVNIVLVLLPLQQDVKDVIRIIDAGLTAAFLADFFGRLLRADSKRDYFFRELGWLDLLGSLPIPGLRLARVFRIVRVVRIVRRTGLKALYSQFVHDRAGSALYSVLFLCLVVVQYCSIFELITQHNAPHANITTASDAVWYVIVTITTVGYGDLYPANNAGRVMGVFTMFVGVGLFGVLTGFLANTFLAPKGEQAREQSDEQPDESAAVPSDSGPGVLREPTGLDVRLDHLTDEVAQLRLLLERLPTSQAMPTTALEATSPNQSEDSAW